MMHSTDNTPHIASAATPLSDGQVQVSDVTHWTDRLFSFSTGRPAGFRFRSGEFVMLGLADDDGKPIMRAYSIASPNWDDRLAFYSIIVPGGPLTSRLQHIAVGDQIMLGKKPTGSLVLDRLRPGKRLYLISTGTGIAPFASIIRDPDTYDRFETVILTHSCRTVDALGYGKAVVDAARQHPLIGSLVRGKLHYFPTVTRDDFHHNRRITAYLQDGSLQQELNLPPLSSVDDRLMVCGSIGLNRDIATMITAAGFTEGTMNDPATFVVERAFVGDGAL